MKEAYYFSHDYDPTSDLKIGALLSDYGATGYGLFWRLVEILHSEVNHKIPHKKYVYISLSKQMGCDVDFIEKFVNSCINTYELFNTDGEYFWSNRVLLNIDKRNSIKEKRKFAGKKSAEIKKQATTNAEQTATSVEHMLTHVEQTETSVEQNSTKERKGKESKRKEKKEDIYIPSFDEVLSYCKVDRNRPNIDVNKLRAKYDSYVEAGWVDGYGNKIVNWKSKFIQVITYIDDSKQSTNTAINGMVY